MHNYTSGYKLLLWVFILSIIGILISLCSCSIAKKTEKAYTGIASYDPLTAKDSANFYKRAKTLIHPPKPTIQPGHTIKVPYPVEKLKLVLDTITQKKLLDSLTAVFKEYEKYNEEDCDRQVKEALNTGYKQGQYEEWLNGRDSITPDIYYVPDSSTILLLDNTRVDLRNAQGEVIRLRTADQIHTSEAKSRLWWIIILGIVLGISTYFNFKGLFTGSSLLTKLKNKL